MTFPRLRGRQSLAERIGLRHKANRSRQGFSVVHHECCASRGQPDKPRAFSTCRMCSSASIRPAAKSMSRRGLATGHPAFDHVVDHRVVYPSLIDGGQFASSQQFDDVDVFSVSGLAGLPGAATRSFVTVTLLPGAR